MKMQRLVLKDWVLDLIKDTPYLLADVATCLNYAPAYTLRLVREKDEKLTQASVLNVIKKHVPKDRLNEDLLIAVKPAKAVA